jgi:hypothetical protein
LSSLFTLFTSFTQNLSATFFLKLNVLTFEGFVHFVHIVQTKKKLECIFKYLIFERFVHFVHIVHPKFKCNIFSKAEYFDLWRFCSLCSHCSNQKKLYCFFYKLILYSLFTLFTLITQNLSATFFLKLKIWTFEGFVHIVHTKKKLQYFVNSLISA